MDHIYQTAMEYHTIDECRYLDIPAFSDERGVLRVIEENNPLLPFDFNRLFIISDVPPGQIRAKHAPQHTHELLIAYSGGFTLNLDDGRQKAEFRIDQPERPFYLPCGIWRTLGEFKANTICIVLANGQYQPDDNILDYGHYLELVR